LAKCGSLLGTVVTLGLFSPAYTVQPQRSEHAESFRLEAIMKFMLSAILAGMVGINLLAVHRGPGGDLYPGLCIF
jgi:hypothetical protein